MADRPSRFEGDDPTQREAYRVLFNGQDVVGTVVDQLSDVYLADVTQLRCSGATVGYLIVKQRHWETGEVIKNLTSQGVEEFDFLTLHGDVKIVPRLPLEMDTYDWFVSKKNPEPPPRVRRRDR